MAYLYTLELYGKYCSLCSGLKVQDLFHVEYGEVFNIPLPSRAERFRFFQDLILNQAAKAPVSKREAGECFSLLNITFL